MRRILTVVAVAALLLVALAVPAAFAQGQGPSACKEQLPGEYISAGARDEEGHSGERNPGNAKNEFPPFIPFAQFDPCNPTAT
jgi:uncharacterized low-complexity protein